MDTSYLYIQEVDIIELVLNKRKGLEIPRQISDRSPYQEQPSIESFEMVSDACWHMVGIKPSYKAQLLAAWP